MSTPEAKARQTIDAQLKAAVWVVQDHSRINLGAGPGVAMREFPLKTGFADYLLFAERKAVGVVEAKAVGRPARLSDLAVEEWQDVDEAEIDWTMCGWRFGTVIWNWPEAWPKSTN